MAERGGYRAIAPRRRSRRKLRFNSAPRRALRAEMIRDVDFTCPACGWRYPDPPADYDGSYTLTAIVDGKLRYLAIDHVVPVSRGGTNSRENLQVLCSRCNGSKGNRETV